MIKGEKHHWWPEVLARYWLDDNGLVSRIDDSGQVISTKPNKLGKISDGHNIIFEEETPWQSTIEHYFDNADSNMPRIIEWLKSFENEAIAIDNIDKYCDGEGVETKNFDILRECLISLILRSPRYRNAQNLFVESFRGQLEKSESKRLIAANIHQKYSVLINASKGVGKFALLFSINNEFIYGDGVYSSINSATENLFGVKAVVPMTPNITVIWSSPMSYRNHPILVPIVADKGFVEIVNYSVQVYSKNYLFYRNQQPELIDDFKLCDHRIFQYSHNPFDSLIQTLIPDDSKRHTQFHPNFT